MMGFHGLRGSPRRLPLVAAATTLTLLGGLAVSASFPDAPDESTRPSARVGACDDFEVDGSGANAQWQKAAWVELVARQDGAKALASRWKALYSRTGVYFLMEGKDRRLSAKFQDDFENLWTEDVFEVFLWTDERWPIYFEYEISPLNRELPILIPNLEGQFIGWRPWHYDGARRVRKATATLGGKKESGAAIEGWRAEFFVPYELLSPLKNVPPRPGARWRANFYRMDYDDGQTLSWHWAPVGRSFHEYESFGVLVFD